jgi:uncharacterized protein YndB with AHSA1/START domain
MSKVIHREADSQGSPASVYRFLSDSATWPDWTPIERCEITIPESSGQPEERTFSTGRITVRERVVEKVPARRLVYTLLDGLPLKDYRAVIELSPTARGGTHITWHTTFEPKVLGTGWLYRRALDKATARFVEGLAQHAHQAERATPS